MKYTDMFKRREICYLSEINTEARLAEALALRVRVIYKDQSNLSKTSH